MENIHLLILVVNQHKKMFKCPKLSKTVANNPKFYHFYLSKISNEFKYLSNFLWECLKMQQQFWTKFHILQKSFDGLVKYKQCILKEKAENRKFLEKEKR